MAAAAVFGMAHLAGCAGETVRDAPPEFRGTVLPEPIVKADFTLTDTGGRPFQFRAETDGHLVLLFFGYTNCPDVCPVHMANIAAALERFPREIRNRVKVVFVTTDPERDTPQRIREWLDRFDPSFIGLRGARSEVDRIQRSFGLTAAVPGPVRAGGEYAVGHAAQVIAFTPDDRAHVVYPFGTRQDDWLHDLPALLVREW